MARSVCIVERDSPRCSLIVEMGAAGCLTQADKQFNIRQYLDTLLTTTCEGGPMMEMPVECAEYVHPPVQGCFQHRIILFIVGNQPSATLWIN